MRGIEEGDRERTLTCSPHVAPTRKAKGRGVEISGEMAGLGQGSNPCNVLNTYHNGCRYSVRGEVGPPHSKIFTMAVSVNDEEFIGSGRSKKAAKQAAAAEALRTLYKLQLRLSEECK